MDIRTPLPGYWSIPEENPIRLSPAHRSARGIRAKIREKSFPESPGFYYLSAVRLFACAATAARIQRRFRPNGNHARRRCFSRGTKRIRQNLALSCSQLPNLSLLPSPPPLTLSLSRPCSLMLEISQLAFDSATNRIL